VTVAEMIIKSMNSECNFARNHYVTILKRIMSGCFFLKTITIIH